ncbi:MAG: metallophosphoesterase [Oscillospiraceae bacterium]|jgi:predicted phosphodiesterase
MIYITGDIHGDISRFKDKRLKKLKKADYLIVCGDFGFLWEGTKKEQRILRKLGKKKYTILFVEGCHENYNLLYSYNIQPWNGGEVRVLSGKLRQLVRGSIFNIDGMKIFAFGGGQGADNDIRKKVKTCWREELPTDNEIISAIKNLKDNNDSVDYIITHEPPAFLHDYLDVDAERLQTNQLNAAFNTIADGCKFKRWFFGKCHKNKTISPHFQAVFCDIVKAE